MEYSQLKDKFLDFFEKKGHKILPSFSLLPPEYDPTLLLVNAGMVPLKPYFLSQKDPLKDFGSKKVATIQRCVRTLDIEKVGQTPRHLTFFEMMGNFSFGDYFKEEAIAWSLDFLTKNIGLPKERLYITVFKGNKKIPADEESIKIWQKNGINKIYKFSEKDNFWGPPGLEGPCGPNTEIHYDRGEEFKKEKCTIKGCGPNCECGRFVEIWNLVFMEYYKDRDGNFQKLKQQNVDTGMGLERVLMILNSKESVFETEVFWPIIECIQDTLGVNYQDSENKRMIRIIADHLKAAIFMIADGIVPSNIERGYILRRLLRRSIHYRMILKKEKNFSGKIAEKIIEIYRGDYPFLENKKEEILLQINKEEEKFSKVISQGLKYLEKEKAIDGVKAFYLFSTYGLPLELIEEVAREKNIKVDREGFYQEFKKHQEISRAKNDKRFVGGLESHSERVIKLHTAHHLLLAALRKILGDHVHQKGSNINEERLRLDFSHPQKLTEEQLKKVEDFVNQAILQKLDVFCQEVDLETAKKFGALGEFEAKYQPKVTVYTIGDTLESGNFISAEICGGPHVKNTGELGIFKILKEESVAAGIRRIKATLIEE